MYRIFRTYKLPFNHANVAIKSKIILKLKLIHYVGLVIFWRKTTLCVQVFFLLIETECFFSVDILFITVSTTSKQELQSRQH